ncbi:MAG: hypothetical protein V3U68_02595, partial [Bacteroidota bacterium]
MIRRGCITSSPIDLTIRRERVRFGFSICGFCLSTLLLLSYPLAAQQNVIKVVFEEDASRNSVIGKFELNGVSYGSLNDFSELLRLNTYANLKTRKFEVKLPRYRVRLTADNPFIVISDSAGENQSIIQMSANVLVGAGAFFVPVEEFLGPFNQLYDGTVTYDKSTETIRVAMTVRPSAYDIGDLIVEQRKNGFLIRIKATRHFDEYESWLRQDNWLYVT